MPDVAGFLVGFAVKAKASIVNGEWRGDRTENATRWPWAYPFTIHHSLFISLHCDLDQAGRAELARMAERGRQAVGRHQPLGGNAVGVRDGAKVRRRGRNAYRLHAGAGHGCFDLAISSIVPHDKDDGCFRVESRAYLREGELEPAIARKA